MDGKIEEFFQLKLQKKNIKKKKDEEKKKVVSRPNGNQIGNCLGRMGSKQQAIGLKIISRYIK